MQLHEWLKLNKVKMTDFALKLGVDRSHIYRFFQGLKKPTKRLMKSIKKITRNQIVQEEQLLYAKERTCPKEDRKP